MKKKQSKLMTANYVLLTAFFALLVTICYPIRFIGGIAINCLISCLKKLNKYPPADAKVKSIKDSLRAMNQNKKLKNK